MPEPSTPPTRLYNTLTKRVEPVTPKDPTRVTFYTCGPTVYDDAHIGNFRSFLAADLLRRWLESPLCTLTDDAGQTRAGPREVVHVMNITDVGHMTDDDTADGSGEDKMAVAGRRIAEAKKSGKLPKGVDVDPNDPLAIARFYTDRFLDDARKLGLKIAIEAADDPSLMPRATDNIEGMRTMIENLARRGFAYAAGDAVYFDVQKYAQYGELSGNTLDKLRGGAGGRVSDENQASKRHPADFLLWKADPKHLMRWAGPVIDTKPIGEGYPGWHIECSVMSLGRLDADNARHEIDLHSGGEDNIFPHHECERAQSCAATGSPRFSRHWFHPRFLMVEGAKMSKSKGTFYTARDLFEQGHEPAAVRLELIKTHYRSNADFSMQGLKDSARQVERWRKFVEAGETGATGGENVGARAEFAGAMSEDLNIAGAIGAINKWISATDSPTKADAELMRTFDAVLGVLALERAASTSTDIGVYQGVDPSPEVESKLAARAAARKAKDFAAADAIRDELAAMGLAIKDVAGGKVEVSRG
ncbi:MAG: hypothetical protein R3B57_06190 [Phycisphaerales bacterium]